jgi:hypothetical protein
LIRVIERIDAQLKAAQSRRTPGRFARLTKMPKFRQVLECVRYAPLSKLQNSANNSFVFPDSGLAHAMSTPLNHAHGR